MGRSGCGEGGTAALDAGIDADGASQPDDAGPDDVDDSRGQNDIGFVNVTYTGTLPGEVFGHIGTTSDASFDSTNVIKNCTITGASGAGSITVTGGTASPSITNSVGDGASPITVQ